MRQKLISKTLSVDTSILATKSDLASLKAESDNIDIDKLKAIPANLSKLSNIAGNDVVKKTAYGKLVTTANAIVTNVPSTSRLVTKAQYDSDNQNSEKKNRRY